MNKLKFNSQVCTTKEQSQRLLEVGLKSETADMYIFGNEVYIGKPNIDDIPAWSLHRLMEMIPIDLKPRDNWYSRITDGVVILYISFDSGAEVLKSFDDNSNLYDNIIDCIKWLIKEKYFNKEYLIERQNENKAKSSSGYIGLAIRPSFKECQKKMYRTFYDNT